MSLQLEIPEYRDVIKDELAAVGEWVVAGINTSIAWPVKAQRVSHGGVELWIIPITKDRYPGVALKRPTGLSREDAERIVMRFLSAVAWVHDGGILLDHFTGGSRPNPMGRPATFGISIRSDFDLSYLPEPENPKARLALALMREGRGLKHAGYAFLSLYRVLEVALPGKQRGSWIAKNLDEIRDHRAKVALSKLRAIHSDIGGHLREARRHAIAHAASAPISDPDDPSDMRQIQQELPIIEALAMLAIEKELRVETSHTVWSKHLYELAGFKKVLGQELVDLITSGRPVERGRLVDLPPISIRLRNRDAYVPLSNLQPVTLDLHDGRVRFFARSADGCFGFQCFFDFFNERLIFDVDQDLLATDDQTPDGADAVAEVGRFCKDYWLNGELRIVDAETGELLSRKDAFMPVNVMVDVDAFDRHIAEWKRRAAERRNESGKQAKQSS